MGWCQIGGFSIDDGNGGPVRRIVLRFVLRSVVPHYRHGPHLPSRNLAAHFFAQPPFSANQMASSAYALDP